MNTDTGVDPLPRLLVVDDDEAFNRVLCRSIGQRGYQVVGARNSEEALVHCREQDPEYIVLDLNIGGESGLKLIRPLLDISPQARILVLTGYASIATAVEAVKLGAVQYLAKPVDVATILSTLASPDDFESTETLLDEPMSVSRLEWEHIQRVLAEHDGNVSAAARALRMHRRTLQRKLAKRPATH